MWPWDATSTFILQRTFGTSLGLNFNLQTLEYISASGDLNLHLESLEIFCFAGSQPQLENSRNILLRWGLNLNLGILEIFCFAGISTSISKHLNYLRYKFWNHWVFLLHFKKSDISTLMLFLYGYVCPVIYMALNAKMFLWWFYAPNFQWSSRRTCNFQP